MPEKQPTQQVSVHVEHARLLVYCTALTFALEFAKTIFNATESEVDDSFPFPAVDFLACRIDCIVSKTGKPIMTIPATTAHKISRTIPTVKPPSEKTPAAPPC